MLRHNFAVYRSWTQEEPSQPSTTLYPTSAGLGFTGGTSQHNVGHETWSERVSSLVVCVCQTIHVLWIATANQRPFLDMSCETMKQPPCQTHKSRNAGHGFQSFQTCIETTEFRMTRSRQDVRFSVWNHTQPSSEIPFHTRTKPKQERSSDESGYTTLK